MTVYAEAFDRDIDPEDFSLEAMIAHEKSKVAGTDFGPKKLSTIRKEIEQALASTGADPIQRLERQIASAKRRGDRTELMEGLKRFLESSRRNRPKRGIETKK